MATMISYSHRDRHFADELEAQLRSHGVNAWIDHHGIAQGAKWRDELLCQLRECNSCIPIISKSYLASEHCKMELVIARSFGRTIIPIMLDDCWKDLQSCEATKGLDDLFILSAFNLNSVGLPITRSELFLRFAQAAKGHGIERSKHVYITYLERDAVLATNVAKALGKRDIPTWIASTDTVAGSNWRSSQVRSMHLAACHFVLLNDGITKNEYVTTEVLMSEAIGTPIFMAFHPEIRSDSERIATLNEELRQSDLAFRRIFDRNAFVIHNEQPFASDDMYQVLGALCRPKAKWFGLAR
jgi:hypothetical protein